MPGARTHGLPLLASRHRRQFLHESELEELFKGIDGRLRADHGRMDGNRHRHSFGSAFTNISFGTCVVAHSGQPQFRQGRNRRTVANIWSDFEFQCHDSSEVHIVFLYFGAWGAEIILLAYNVVKNRSIRRPT